jgi:hypothetical protein
MGLVFGRGNWRDAFGDAPSPGEFGNAGSHAQSNRADARREMPGFLKLMRSSPNFCALDVNDAAFQGSGTSAETVLGDLGWKILIDLRQETSWPRGHGPASYSSVLFLHRPPRYIANTDVRVPLDAWSGKIPSFQKRAEEMHLLQAPARTGPKRPGLRRRTVRCYKAFCSQASQAILKSGCIRHSEVRCFKLI